MELLNSVSDVFPEPLDKGPCCEEDVALAFMNKSFALNHNSCVEYLTNKLIDQDNETDNIPSTSEANWDLEDNSKYQKILFFNNDKRNSVILKDIQKNLKELVKLYNYASFKYMEAKNTQQSDGTSATMNISACKVHKGAFSCSLALFTNGFDKTLNHLGALFEERTDEAFQKKCVLAKNILKCVKKIHDLGFGIGSIMKSSFGVKSAESDVVFIGLELLPMKLNYCWMRDLRCLGKILLEIFAGRELSEPIIREEESLEIVEKFLPQALTNVLRTLLISDLAEDTLNSVFLEMEKIAYFG